MKHVISFRDVINRKPHTKRAPYAIKEIKKYVKKHYRSGNVKILRSVNEKIWDNGITNIPPRIEVEIEKEGDVVYVALSQDEINVVKKKKEKKEKSIEKKGKEEKEEKKEKNQRKENEQKKQEESEKEKKEQNDKKEESNE